MKRTNSHFTLSKANRKGILYLLLLLIGFELFILLYKPAVKQNKTTALQKQQIRLWQKEIDKQNNLKAHSYRLFNPNDLDEKGWIKLGFSKKQSQVILRYKRSLGGFSSLSQIRKCFVISEEKFNELKPYILLKKEKRKAAINTIRISNDLNSCDINSLISIGINRRDAQRIINYRRALGGFYNFDQLKEIYLSPSDIAIIKKNLLLKAPVNHLNINTAPTYILKKHPYLRQDFVDFLKSKRSKGIKFSSVEDLQKQYDKEINKKIIPYLSF